MPYNPETGEWEEEPDGGQQRSLRLANWESMPTPEPEDQPQQYSPTSEQEFRQASMAPLPRGFADLRGSDPVPPPTDYGNEQMSYTPQAQERRLPQIYNMIGGHGPSGEGGEMVEDTRGPANTFTPYAPGLASGVVKGQPNAELLQRAFSQRRRQAPNESPEQSAGWVADQYAGAIQQQRQQQQPLRQLSPEEQLMQTERQLAAVTPSFSENLLMQRLQNGLSSVQEAVANGQLTPQHGQELSAQINQQLQPLMVRRDQIPMYEARARYQHLQMQTAQQEAIAQHTAELWGQTAQQRISNVRLADGSMTSFIEDRSGHLHHISDINQRAQALRSQQQDESHQRIVTDVTHVVDRELAQAERVRPDGTPAVPEQDWPQWMRTGLSTGGVNYDARTLEIARRVAERYQLNGVEPPPAIQRIVNPHHQGGQGGGGSQPPANLAPGIPPNFAAVLQSLTIPSPRQNQPAATPPPEPTRSTRPFGSGTPGYIGGR